MNTTEQAKRLICDIIGVAGGRLARKTVLDRAFYLAHLFHWVENEGVLTNHPMVRLPHGPGVDRGDEIIAVLEREGRIKITHQSNGPYHEEVYELVEPFAANLEDPRQQAIRKALDWVLGKSTNQISQSLHEYSRSWNTAKNGELLNIYTDLLDDTELRQVEADVSYVKAKFNADSGRQAG